MKDEGSREGSGQTSMRDKKKVAESTTPKVEQVVLFFPHDFSTFQFLSQTMTSALLRSLLLLLQFLLRSL
jgi:hypothetical protein